MAGIWSGVSRSGILAIAALILFSLFPGGAEAARKVGCAANTGTDIYVNPVVHRAKSAQPTGVSFPQECAFGTITEAIESAELRGLGTGARIVLTGATDTAPAVFDRESFPLTLPDGMTITTTDDPELAGAGLDPSHYVVPFGGSAAYAVYLSGGGLRGLSITSERARRATMMVICDAGTTEFLAVTLDGKSASGGPIRRGLQLWSGCDLTAGSSPDTPLSVSGVSGDGIVVDQGAQLTMTWGAVHNNGGDGIVVRGRAALDRGEIYLNTDDGVLVDGSDSSTFHGLLVHGNGSNGFEVHRSAATFASNSIWNNSRPLSWDQPQLLFVGPSDPYGVPFWTGTDTVLAYQFGPTDCEFLNAEPNRVFGYNTNSDPVGLSEGSVGLYASGGAIVAADNNSWHSGDPSQNVDHDASSLVDADAICPAGGVILTDPGPEEGTLGP